MGKGKSINNLIEDEVEPISQKVGTFLTNMILSKEKQEETILSDMK